VDSLTVFHALYQALGAVAAVPLAAAYALAGRYGGRWGDRLGYPIAGGRKPVWLHAASVGEAKSAILLAQALQKIRPDGDFLISVGTPQGLAFAEKKLAGQESFQIMAPPLDVWGAPGRTFARVEPRALILVETELWPGLIRRAKSLGVPLFLAAGRLSAKSLGRYLKLKFFFRDLLESFDLIAPISKEDEARFLELGAPPERLEALGNPKHDDLILLAQGPPPPPTSLSPPFLVVAGSTHPGEEEIILNALLKLLLNHSIPAPPAATPVKMIIAPRHPQRAGAVTLLARRLGFKASIVNSPETPTDALPEIGVVSQMGILPAFYLKADLTIVGGSFVEGQGHNPLEPAALGRASAFGPYMSSFSGPARTLMDAAACKMVPPVNLANILTHFLAVPAFAREAGLRGRQAVAALPLAAPLLAERFAAKLWP
jgi:3-deoxy-D-manno-octulosonic-acid transferase